MAKKAPKKNNHPQLFAHRGGLHAGPNTENTLVAFQSAIDVGLNCLETDVILTRDGHVIACHGSQNLIMELVSGLPRRNRLQRMTLSEINKELYSNEKKVVLLADLLHKFPKVRISIDTKTNEVVKPSIEIILNANAAGRVTVTSFSLRRTLMARSLLRGSSFYDSASLCMYSVPARFCKVFINRWCEYLQKKQIKIIHIPHKLVDPRLIYAAHQKNIEVFAWTVNRPKDMKRLMSEGVDGIISDYPDLLKKTVSTL